MIKLSNGHSFEYMVASGALGFDGKGWWWEKPLIWLGIIRPELFTIVLKTLTRKPTKGNLRWWHPWTCVKLIKGGAVNKVGLTNKGIAWWCKKVGPRLNYRKYKYVVSIYGPEEDLVLMAKMLNEFDLVALELNVSCPNTPEGVEQAEEIITAVRAVKEYSRHPLIVKTSYNQKYEVIARGVKSSADALSLNSVWWKTVFEGKLTPFWKLERKLKEKNPNGGGVSGKPAQPYNWAATNNLIVQHKLPVIAPSVMNIEDVRDMFARGAGAVAFGTLFLLRPGRPTQIVRELKREKVVVAPIRP